MRAYMCAYTYDCRTATYTHAFAYVTQPKLYFTKCFFSVRARVWVCLHTHTHTHIHAPGVPNDRAYTPVYATPPQTQSQPFEALVPRSLPCVPNALCRPLEFWQQPVECDLWRAACAWREMLFCRGGLCTLTAVWWPRTRPAQVPAMCMYVYVCMCAWVCVWCMHASFRVNMRKHKQQRES